MFKPLFLLWLLLPLLTISQNSATHVDALLEELHNSKSKYVMVIAHRGDWRNAPENSLKAIQNVIKMGVDVVEIDVQKTKDNQLIIMHDDHLDRTTNGKGLVSEWTLDALKTLYLKDGLGILTSHKIPTLEEALIEARGKILVNLDKCYEYLNEAYPIIEKTKTANQIIIKGYNIPIEKVKSDFEGKERLIYMPIIAFSTTPDVMSVINEFQDKMKPVAFEISSIDKSESPFFSNIKTIKNKGSRVWFNSLWPKQCAGYDDEKATENPNEIYGWYTRNGVNMIQTDRPQLLIDYLSRKGFRQLK